MNLHAAVALIRQAVPDAIALYVFGSHARGDAQAASDVDLALLAPRALDSVPTSPSPTFHDLLARRINRRTASRMSADAEIWI